MKQLVDRHYDNSFDNMGNGNSFVWYGPRWAQASTAPSRLYKCESSLRVMSNTVLRVFCLGWVTEGGIRCPCIIRYRGVSKQNGAISHAFTTVMDIWYVETVCLLYPVTDAFQPDGSRLGKVSSDLGVANSADPSPILRIPHPGSTFQGRQVHKPKGRSWIPWLNQQSAVVHGHDHVVGWELFGQQAIRRGDWKAVFIPKPSGGGRWEVSGPQPLSCTPAWALCFRVCQKALPPKTVMHGDR